VGSNIPDFVTFETHRDADSGIIPDLLAGEITAGMTYESGLVKADLEVITLDPDPTNGDPFDDLSQVYVKAFDVPAFSIRLVAEVTETTASDVDMFLFWDADASGTLDPAVDVLIADSATATALEYINGPKDWIFWNTDDTYLLVVQNWAGAVGDTITLATGIVPLTPEVGNYDVIVPVTNPGATPFQIDVYWNEDTEEGDRLYGYFDTCADAACDGATWIARLILIFADWLMMWSRPQTLKAQCLATPSPIPLRSPTLPMCQPLTPSTTCCLLGSPMCPILLPAAQFMMNLQMPSPGLARWTRLKRRITT